MQKLSTFTIIKNEIDYVGYHIMSLLDFVDEMVFSDGNSTDGTLELIKYIKQTYDRSDKIKLFEDFKSDEFVASEVLSLLRPLGRFYFNYDVRVDGERLYITLSKRDPEGIKVFHSGDVAQILGEIDNYLRLGESMNLEFIYYKGVEGEGSLNFIRDLSKLSGLLSLKIVYVK